MFSLGLKNYRMKGALPLYECARECDEEYCTMRTKDYLARELSGPRTCEAMRRVEPQKIGRDDLRELGMGNGIRGV
jgi:hypothetical protein